MATRRCTRKGELDLDSPALVIGFDVQYEGDNVAYMDLSAGRKGDHDDFRDYASGTDLYLSLIHISEPTRPY